MRFDYVGRYVFLFAFKGVLFLFNGRMCDLHMRKDVFRGVYRFSFMISFFFTSQKFKSGTKDASFPWLIVAGTIKAFGDLPSLSWCLVSVWGFLWFLRWGCWALVWLKVELWPNANWGNGYSRWSPPSHSQLSSRDWKPMTLLPRVSLF